MAVENGLTKIISVDNVSYFGTPAFASSSTVTNFGSSNIKSTLTTYYNNLSSAYKNMIQLGTWCM